MLYKQLVQKVSIPVENKTKQKEYLPSGPLPIIDQGQPHIGGYTSDLSKQIVCTLPVIIFGDHTKHVKYINFPFGAGADGIKILQPLEKILPKFLFYGTQYLAYKIKDKGYARHYQHLEKEDLLLPPIPAQEHIVQKIEELFSELDKGVMELKTAQARLKVYRQAVLKDAFEGNMVYDTIKNQTSLVTSGSRGWAKYHSSVGAKFIRIGNLTRDKIYLNKNKIQHVILPNKAEGVRSKLEKHDLLISITADLGSIAFIHDDIGEAYINQHIALVRFSNVTCAKYYAYYLKSDYGQKELLKNKRGAGKLGLGLEDIRNSKIPIVEKKLYTSIVEHIESRLSVCDNIEQNIEASLEKAESLRQSILKQAFEGKLV